jgi:GntR family transcriptional regulator
LAHRNSRRTAAASSEFFNVFPRYMQVRNILMRRLGDGFAPGDRFPTEHQLCDEFGVSRETVREALRGLESEGLVVRYRGKGSFVARVPAVSLDERLTGLVEDFTELKLDTRVEVVKAGLEKPPARIAIALGLDPSARLFRISRLRSVDDKPFAWHEAHLPSRFGAALASLDLTRTTLFRELRDSVGLKLVEIYQHIDATTADVALARMLKIEVGMPILVTRRALTHLRSDAPTMFFETYFRADRYYYSVQPGGHRPTRPSSRRMPSRRVSRAKA